MNKKNIIFIVLAIVLIFVISKIFSQPEEFQVEEVMFDRGSDEN
jgi:regulator of protease activity HflC (stomatin/prohibitin superfamily)